MALENDIRLATPEVAFWKNEIQLAEKTADKWVRRGRRIYKRYKDIRSPREEAITRLNILWSNVQTRLPALYARDPKPEVERRYRDKDPVGRQVAEILERSLEYSLSHCNPFMRIMRQCVLDYELPGRATVWVRYVPHLHKMPGATNEEQAVEGEQLTSAVDTDDATSEQLTYEECLVDYVYWEDFGHTFARTWDEVRAVWRIVYLTREEGLERFGKEFEDVPLDWSPKTLTDTKIRQDQKKAVIYEIWDKQEKKVVWLSKNHPKLLDEKDDPLNLEQFFPCPPPLFANLAPDELIPTPNFTFYQDQANEIDELSSRITAIGKALKVAGVRDSSAEGLDRLLSEGTENQLVPVDGWMALKEKGGLAGVMELLPLKDIAQALGYLREQRQMMIDDVYQITGLSDIIRGLSEPNETATAQQIKGQFAVLRISDAQTEVQRFCRDIIRIMSQIIAGFDIETLKQISGVKLLTSAEKEQISAQLQIQQQMQAMQQPQMPQQPNPGAGGGDQGQPPPPMAAAQPGSGQPNSPAPGQKPLGTDKLELMKQPSWEDVAALMENPVLREFRIDVETDSTIRLDEDREREARMAFITSVSSLIAEASSVPQAMIPAAGELILFGIRGFKVARSLERTFEEAIEKLSNQPPAPNPEMMKVQIETQSAMQIAQMKAQSDAQVAQHKAQLDAQVAQSAQSSQAQEDQVRSQMEMQRSLQEQAAKSAHEKELADLKARFEAEKTQFETAAKLQMSDADNATKLQIAQMNHQHELALKGADQEHERVMTSAAQDHERKLAEHQSKSQVEVEGVKASNAKDIEKVRGDQAERAVKAKPEAEKEAKEKGNERTLKAIEKLTEALQRSREPRKVVRDEKGQITGIH